MVISFFTFFSSHDTLNKLYNLFMIPLLGCLFFLAKILFLIFIILEIAGVIQGLFAILTSLGVSCFKGACLSTHPCSLK